MGASESRVEIPTAPAQVSALVCAAVPRLLPCLRFYLDLGKAELAKSLQDNEI
jgi:hypothetical protein